MIADTEKTKLLSWHRNFCDILQCLLQLANCIMAVRAVMTVMMVRAVMTVMTVRAVMAVRAVMIVMMVRAGNDGKSSNDCS